MGVSAYPLAWPASRKRTPPNKRKDGRFNSQNDKGLKRAITVGDAIDRLSDELDRLGARLPVLSTNIETRLDGSPRLNQAPPSDPGVALHFQLDGKPVCMPCDTYNRVADNVAAISAHIEATRAIARHGVASVEEMFSAFTALPAPGAKRPWHEVLAVYPTAFREEIEVAYRALARKFHPDAGGSEARMAEINVAREEGLKANG